MALTKIFPFTFLWSAEYVEVSSAVGYPGTANSVGCDDFQRSLWTVRDSKGSQGNDSSFLHWDGHRWWPELPAKDDCVPRMHPSLIILCAASHIFPLVEHCLQGAKSPLQSADIVHKVIISAPWWFGHVLHVEKYLPCMGQRAVCKSCEMHFVKFQGLCQLTSSWERILCFRRLGI